MKSNNKNNDPIMSLSHPWDNNENTVWLASTVSLTRNVERFKFPGKLEADRQKQIISLISKGLLSNELLNKPQLYRAEEISPLQKEFLVEHFFSQYSFHQAHSGEAFIVDQTGEFLATINIRDHLHLHYLDCKNDLENTWNRLVAIETNLGKQVSYAFSPKYGFLTADYNLCGTALNVSLFLQVPALVHTSTIDDVLERLLDPTLTVTGIQGDPSEIIGDVIVVQNNYTLGVNEEGIIAGLRGFATKLLMEENGTRQKIQNDNDDEIKDKVSRAFGILFHSYQIEAVEALNALSLLKLGLELDWVSGITIPQINQLFFQCRRSHLIKNHNAGLKPEEIPHKRAEFIHRLLKEVHLTI